jgi:GH35 family endo-1,4-beta-xylanase
MMHKDIFAEGMKLDSQAVYFDWAKAVAPGVSFYVNEYGILSGNDADRYVKHIRVLLDNGAAIGGIGMQAHFFKPVPANEQLWATLEKFRPFDLPVRITEFDLHYEGMTDEQQAEQLRRFYKTCFAHPSVVGIHMWGLWQGSHWRPQAAMWRKDWTPRPAAEAYVKLMTDTWRTRGLAAPDDNGRFSFRGFYGTYRFRHGERTGKVELTKGSIKATARLD